MTLIARSRNFSAPTMIGDLLITDKKESRAFILPAIGRDISHLIPAGEAKPVGMAQKIYILNDNICIAFSGMVHEIRDLLEDFRIYFSMSLPAEKIKQIAEAYDYANFKRSAYLMMIIDNKNIAGDGYVNVLEISYGKFSSEHNQFFNEIHSAGSGKYDFASIVNEKRKFFSSFDENDPRQAIVKNGSLIPRLLAEERYFLRPLQKQWGGGYEFVFYNGSKFQKLNNIAFILQTGNYDKNGAVGITLPLMINHYHYEGNDLIITAVEMHDLKKIKRDNFIVLRSTKLRAGSLSVPQLKRGENIYEKSHAVESFETCSVGMGFIIGAPFDNIFKPSFYSGTKALTISFSFEKKSVEICMHEEALQFIDRMFKNAYPEFTKQ